jgi:hypothetical protein
MGAQGFVFNQAYRFYQKQYNAAQQE